MLCKPMTVIACCFDLNDRNHQSLSEYDNDRAAAADNAEDVDPKLKEAILKSRKLDRILQQKFHREKNVKRERLEQNQRFAVPSTSH